MDNSKDAGTARDDSADYGRIGVLGYLSKSPGIGGRIKEEIGDFIVEEITLGGVVLEIGKRQEFPPGGGEYTHFTLEKTNWDTMRAAKAVAKSCRVSHSRIKFAGTKDRRSVSAQRMSIWRVPPETLEKVKIKDITLRDFSLSEEPVNLGESLGNRFTIKVKGVGKDADKKIKKIASELDGRTPNFFGSQRFGLRLNNHIVGKHILRGEFKEAVMSYLCDTGNEPDEATQARMRLKETGDFKEAFHSFPDYLGFEKAVLNHLAKTPTDIVGAFHEVPKKLRLMFVHAYQGYIFNLALSEYMRRGERPEELPMAGHEISLDQITEGILKEEGMSKENFRSKSMPEMSMPGEMREAFVEFKDFGISDFNPVGGNITVRFSLPPGAYATVLLRELMK